MPDLNSRNHFYLGAEHDLATGETAIAEKPLLYKSKDLTTHAMCVGMTGSGKTGLCLSLIEEALLDGVPVIAIDPKGDLGNLLLAFDDYAPEKFREYVDESAAERKGMTPEAMAEKTAELWKEGHATWGQSGERVKQYNDNCERLIFTPGSSAGIPLTVLKSFDAPPEELRDDAEALGERITSAVSGLLALLGIDADPVQDREHIFLSNVLKHAWEQGQDLSIEKLIEYIQLPPFDKVGALSLDLFYPEKHRAKLAMQLNNLLASPSFAGWMQGQALNVSQLMHNDAGKPRLSIISIAHLDDSQRMFFVTILLNEMLAWMRTQPGTSSLRALLYMDEVYGYFPPTANPPSKRPMLTLLKQARAFGLGVVLATQNPVDLDYKGLSNCGTWFLGRLQTERDKARVIEGLEGASAQAGSAFDKQAMEATLAGLGSRVFLMNNVHEDAPVVFHTRWALSYLCGPLARDKIKTLMDPVRKKFLPPPEPPSTPEANGESADNASDDARDDAKAQQAQSEESSTEETKAKPSKVAATAELKQQVAKIESRYAKRLAEAIERVEKASAYYDEQKWQVPGKLLLVAMRVVPWFVALLTSSASKRKGSSATSAMKQAWTEFDQARRARDKWAEAVDELKQVIAERKDAFEQAEHDLTGERSGAYAGFVGDEPAVPPTPASGWLMWGILAMVLLLVLAAGAFLVWRFVLSPAGE